jgi:hypothetical protein
MAKKRVGASGGEDSEISRVLFDRDGRLLEGREAKEVRAMVGEGLLINVERLLRLSLHGKDGAARRWAGEVLAIIGSRIAVEEGKLLKWNKGYGVCKRRIGKKLGTVLYPKALISQVVQVELSVAESVRDLLVVLDFTCGDWKREAKQLGIDERYWPVMGLPELSLKSERWWWKLLWKLIKENYPGLLRKLQEESVANEKKGWSGSGDNSGNTCSYWQSAGVRAYVTCAKYPFASDAMTRVYSRVSCKTFQKSQMSF